MKYVTKPGLGYTRAVGCRIVLSAHIFHGVLDNGQIVIKIPQTHTDHWLLRLPECRRDALLQSIMSAADTILGEAFDEYIKELDATSKKPAVKAIR